LGAAAPASVTAVTRGDLADKIARRIRAEGPLSVAAYMAMALHDPVLGYYATRRPIGAGGDFITAPEISQIFGELIGLWCALVWERIGRPNPVILAELGPGSGALAADLLRGAAVLPEFGRAIRLHLVEVNSVLRAEQQRRLAMADPVWLTRVEDLPDGSLLLVANEFLDALPIRQLVRGRRHWAERLVTLDRNGRFAFGDGVENPAFSLLVPKPLRDAAPPGAVFEICPPMLALAAALGMRLKHQPGAALFIDYGRFPSAIGSSLRAVQHHRPVHPLVSPGAVDLSADVDFAALAQAARSVGAEARGPVPQGRFLEDLGALQRLAALSERASPAQRRQLESGVERLLDRKEMGVLLKVLVLTTPGLPAPPGFNHSDWMP
jgi:NADH dehydrogenase [ubiquinone] 1 alpha subcomplex assembly factor 7